MAAKANKGKRADRILAIGTALVLAAIVTVPRLFFWILPNQRYKKAQALLEEKQYTRAVEAFRKVINFKDSSAMIAKCYYRDGTERLDAGDYLGAVQLLSKTSWKDAPEQLAGIRLTLARSKTLEAGAYHTVGVKADGTVIAAGNNEYSQCEVSGWTDIVAVSAGGQHTVGLKADGTVVATRIPGSGDQTLQQVQEWKNIKLL